MTLLQRIKSEVLSQRVSNETLKEFVDTIESHFAKNNSHLNSEGIEVIRHYTASSPDQYKFREIEMGIILRIDNDKNKTYCIEYYRPVYSLDQYTELRFVYRVREVETIDYIGSRGKPVLKQGTR